MERSYSQFKGMMAIVKASFRAQMKTPIAFVFSFFFPLFFILIFGSSRNAVPSVRVVVDPASDTTNAIYKSMKASRSLYVLGVGNMENVKDSLEKGRIAAIMKLVPDSNAIGKAQINMQSSLAAMDKYWALKQSIQAILFDISFSGKQTINEAPPVGNRVFKAIDFILPGQLGFSLLSAGLFGLSFLFFGLRETLVLKRLNATPIRKPFIILGEALARIFFQMIIIAVIIMLGKYMFGFTLVHGATTFIQLMFLSFIGLLVFMGFGFVISGISKSMNSVPVYTNLLGFPQFMLSGTFFPYESLPKFLHPVSEALPLTHLNTALRKISFEGLTLTSCLPEMAILGLWTIILYGLAFRVFKWE